MIIYSLDQVLATLLGDTEENKIYLSGAEQSRFISEKNLFNSNDVYTSALAGLTFI